MARPELILGIVGAVGTDHQNVVSALQSKLSDVQYKCELIRVIDLLASSGLCEPLPSSPEETRIRTRMDAGDTFRASAQRHDALSLLVIDEIADRRKALTGDEEVPAEGTAYVLHSLKRPEEVETLRRIYRDSFFLIGAYSPRDVRVSRLAEKIARSHHDPSFDAHRSAAEHIVHRDLDDQSSPFGQRLRDTFALADVFVRADEPSLLASSLGRFVELLFGYPFHTPTRDESGMYFAHVAAVRSAALPRQVGAALTTVEGSLISTGCNEVPASRGGQYWSGDRNDARDHVREWDSSDLAKLDMAADALKRLRENGWLSKEVLAIQPEELVERSLKEGGPFKGSQLASVVEYGRVIHAEMDALTDATRRGVPTQGAVLYTTTFPCHNCARHIVAAGIARVVFVEPYPKSRATELHQDAISLEPTTDDGRVRFEPFVGISARLYMTLFKMTKRKDAKGRALVWHAGTSEVRVSNTSPLYVKDEQVERVNFLESLRALGIISGGE